MVLLSITIPTYNRTKLLLENLNSLIPQLLNNNDVELLIFDNCSTDDTETNVLELTKKCSNVRYIKNSSNLGYVGNQINCIKHANGIFTAFLCDDDIYINGAVNKILDVIKSNKQLSFIALNYYSFKSEYKIKYHTNFAPIINKVFKRPYDIMNYPSVGHFSGYIFNSILAKNVLNDLFDEYGDDLCNQFESHRGIVSQLANLSLSKSTLPSYFIGEQFLAVRIPNEIDYDLLYHLNYNYLKYYNNLFITNIIDYNDYRYRLKIVLSNLPKALFIESSIKSKLDYLVLREKFDELLIGNSYYKYMIRPIFKFSQNKLVKFMWNKFYKFYKRL